MVQEAAGREVEPCGTGATNFGVAPTRAFPLPAAVVVPGGSPLDRGGVTRMKAFIDLWVYG
jgi:hypothetical protein